MMITKIIAKIGMKIEIIVITTEVPVSIVDTIGFAKPPVVVVEVSLATGSDVEGAAGDRGKPFPDQSGSAVN